MTFLRFAGAVLLVGAVAAVRPAPALAQAESLTGLWELTWETPRGEQTLTLTLEQTDAAFSGTAETRMGEVPVKDGVVEGDQITFVIEMTMGRPGGGQTRTIEQSFAGTLEDGVVTGEMSRPAMGPPGGGGGRGGGMGGPLPFTMKRVEG